jgi:DNA polymerase III subunit delta'
VARFRTRGHGQALAFVERAVNSQRPPHAVLLSGPARVGKTSLAYDLAGGLLCLADDPSTRPCHECAACRKVEHGNHPDLHLLAPQGAGQQIRIGQVQSLIAELALLPLEGRFRVAIVEQAQRLNIDAQNALLKTLEEPPAAVSILLAADDSSALLPTVVSRCARLRLAPVGVEVIGQLLEEKGLADASRAVLLAGLAAGRPGLALALAATPEALLIRARLARTLIALLGKDRRQRLAAQAELLDDGAALARLTEPGAPTEHAETDAPGPREAEQKAARGRRHTPAERRAAVVALIAVWRDVSRDLALAGRGAGRELQLRDLLDELSSAAQRVAPAGMSRFLQRLEALGRAIEAYANPELALDVLLLEWPVAADQAAA